MQACCVVPQDVSSELLCGQKRKLVDSRQGCPKSIKKIRTTSGYEMSREEFSQALMKVFNKSRRELATMVGAIHYAQKQHIKQRKTTKCVCCDRQLSEHQKKLDDYEKRINRAIMLLKKSELSSKLIKCAGFNEQLALELPMDCSPTESELKIGEKIAIRRQKQRALVEKRCTICSTPLSTAQLGTLLSIADRRLRE